MGKHRRASWDFILNAAVSAAGHREAEERFRDAHPGWPAVHWCSVCDYAGRHR